jgi:chemotaxis methyl-accepting protein methylase
MQTTDAGLELWREYVEQRCGMSFSDTRLRVLARCLTDRVKAGAYRGLTEYYHAMVARSHDDREWDALFQALLNNETRFFRDGPAFTALTTHIVPDLRRLDKPTLNFWSAGCSTGQEAYSLAMTCLDADLHRGRTLRVTGTDVNPDNLAKATRGRYRLFETRSLDEHHLRRFFVAAGNDAMEVNASLRAVTAFQWLDLMSDTQLPLPPQDVIFCQNVLIYYSATARCEIVRRLTECLSANGYLLLGAAEAVGLPTPGLELVRLSDTWMYRRTTTEPSVRFA